MGEINNLANALLILGLIYLYLEHGSDGILTFLLLALAVITWVVPSFSNEKKDYMKAQIEYIRAKANWYNKRKA
jgi:hypothetical protein